MKDEKRVELENGCYRIDILYHNVIVFVNYYDTDGKQHRGDNRPACIEYEDDVVYSLEFFIHGVNRRTDGEPSRIDYNDDGSIRGYCFTDEDGKAHCLNDTEPCSIYYCDGSINEVCYNIHGKETQVDPTKAWSIHYWENKIDILTYKDGEDDYAIGSGSCSYEQLRYYNISKITPYKVKKQNI